MTFFGIAHPDSIFFFFFEISSMFDMGVVNSQLVIKYTNLGAGGRFRPSNFGHCHV